MYYLLSAEKDNNGPSLGRTIAAVIGLVLSLALLLFPSLSYARHSLGLRDNAGFNIQHRGSHKLYRAS
jgi:hypothetical protein